MKTICEIKGCSNVAEKGEKYCKYHLTEMGTFKDRVARTNKVLVKVCKEPGCGRPALSKGLCSTHYNRQWRETRTTMKTCSHPGCDNILRSRGLCSTHYKQLYKELKQNGTYSSRIATKESPRICSVPGCGRRHKGRGLCSTHYNKIYNSKSNRPKRSRTDARKITATYMSCIVMGCNTHPELRGLCTKHARRMAKTGYAELDKYKMIFGEDVKVKPVEIVKAPTKLQPLDPNIAIAYYGSVLEELGKYKRVIKIAREMFEMHNKITAIDITCYNDANRVFISECLYRLYYKYNMGLVPFVTDQEK